MKEGDDNLRARVRPMIEDSNLVWWRPQAGAAQTFVAHQINACGYLVGSVEPPTEFRFELDRIYRIPLLPKNLIPDTRYPIPNSLYPTTHVVGLGWC